MDYTEFKIQKYILQEGWDINYRGGNIVNIWGTEYDVDIRSSERCLELPGITYPLEKQIILKEPCTLKREKVSYTEVAEDMASVLAHEVGHADTWTISAVLPYIVLSFGITAAIKQKSFKPVKIAAAGIVGCKVFIDELLAETAATVFHDVPFMKSMRVCLPDLELLLRQIATS